MSDKEYSAWLSMKARCNNPKNKSYARYGAKGIKVCKRWMESYDNFLNDMGRAPSPKHSIDRIDVNGDYRPGNCRWATPIEQANNTRTNVLFKIGGESMTLSMWCRKFNIKYMTVFSRLKRGWDIHRALTTPNPRIIEGLIVAGVIVLSL